MNTTDQTRLTVRNFAGFTSRSLAIAVTATSGWRRCSLRGNAQRYLLPSRTDRTARRERYLSMKPRTHVGSVFE